MDTDVPELTRTLVTDSQNRIGPGKLSVSHGPNERVAVADLVTAVDLYDNPTKTSQSTTERTRHGQDRCDQ